MSAARYWLHRAALLLPIAGWYLRRPFHAARLSLRSLNYEPQHVDPWGAEAERIYNDVLPPTLPAPEFEPVLVAPRIVGGTHWLAAEIADMQAEEDERLLDDTWLHAHWWWYAQERQREADSYHNRIEADRRRHRLENGLPALELAAAA